MDLIGVKWNVVIFIFVEIDLVFVQMMVFGNYEMQFGIKVGESGNDCIIFVGFVLQGDLFFCVGNYYMGLIFMFFN